MSQENSTTEKSNGKRTRILLGALILVLIGAIYFQFISGGNQPPVTAPVAARGRATPAPAPTPRAGERKVPTISAPLDLASMTNRTGAGDGTGRNIFIYPTPTPPPTPKPMAPTPTPIPPPITLFSATPGSVFARSPDFNLAVFGEKIPQDGKILINGREFPTTFVSARELRARVTGDAIRSAASLGILVRSSSDAKLYSNQLPLNVSEPPPPPYRYIGRIEKRTGAIAVLKAQNDDPAFSVAKDAVFGGKWKVISISPQRIVLEDTTIKVTHTVNFTGETG
jgi:hypothetical protein